MDLGKEKYTAGAFEAGAIVATTQMALGETSAEGGRVIDAEKIEFERSGGSLGSSSAVVPGGGGAMTFSGFGTVSATSLMGFQYAVAGA